MYSFKTNSISIIYILVYQTFWALVLLGYKRIMIMYTTSNFILALLLVVPFSLYFSYDIKTSSYGFILAIISGAITSGLGYSLWYWILPKINISSASIAQLTVPLIAALGGYLFISETLNWQFYISSILILGGLLLPLIYKKVSK